MDLKNICHICNEEIRIDCEWRQGRCPHRTPFLTNFHFRYLTLFRSLKLFFTKDKK